MPGSTEAFAGATRHDHSRPLHVVAAGLLAFLPGLVALQVIPRLLGDSESPRIAAALGVMSVLFPLSGAAAGGLALRSQAGASGLRAAVVPGIAAQLPAIPGYLQAFAAALQQGFFVDAAVYTALLVAYVVVSLGASLFTAGVSVPLARGPRLALASLASVLFATALLALSTPQAPWSYALVPSLAAAVLFLPSGHPRPRGRTGSLALVLAALSAAAASLAALLAVASFVR